MSIFVKADIALYPLAIDALSSDRVVFEPNLLPHVIQAVAASHPWCITPLYNHHSLERPSLDNERPDDKECYTPRPLGVLYTNLCLIIVMQKEMNVSFIQGINEPKDMLLKLIREGNRVIFEESPIELTDHFFNFSVTAHSLRDWYIKFANLQSQKKQLNNIWDQNPTLVVAKDVANSVKHFGITLYTPSLSGSSVSSTGFVAFTYGEDIPAKMEKAREDENFRKSETQPRPSYLIKFTDGTDIDLTDYVFKTTQYWVEYFDKNKVPRDTRYDSKHIYLNRKMWFILE